MKRVAVNRLIHERSLRNNFKAARLVHPQILHGETVTTGRDKTHGLPVFYDLYFLALKVKGKQLRLPIHIQDILTAFSDDTIGCKNRIMLCTGGVFPMAIDPESAILHFGLPAHHATPTKTGSRR